ncbi:hypothetical protein I6E52_10125 [Salinibacterium sp. NG253]|uniref:hypothetical protein n=1 Tax=Salinibacterium sp. NG253 TaxID=2792039 RepID=UPI0018CDAEB6|nr:hypothetical protein [Salinibacterium sp. NG253]MBH0117201.1 hypothetical protein [Salinibacterium sp. NG253]
MTIRTPSPLNERHEVLGVLLFVFAGCGFVVLSALAGTAAIMATGVPAVVPVAWNVDALHVASAAWWLGLLVALAGLVIWIIRAQTKRTLLPWAIVDFAVMVSLVATVWLWAF